MDSDKILKIKGKTIRRDPNLEEIVMLAKRIQNKLLRIRILFQCTLMFSESQKYHIDIVIRNSQAFIIVKLILRLIYFVVIGILVICHFIQ